MKVCEKVEQLKTYSDSFKIKFEKFLNGCDAVEELEQWDLEENGEMDVFYSADLTSIVVRLIAADGNISQKEVDYLNDFFGFDYTVNELIELYDDCADAIDNLLNDEAENGLNLLRSINERLANAYVDLILTLCDIVIASDDVIDKAEVELAKQIKEWAE